MPTTMINGICLVEMSKLMIQKNLGTGNHGITNNKFDGKFTKLTYGLIGLISLIDTK
jgi:hypothetical protein